MVTLLYRTLQSKLRYDTVIRRTWMMAVDSNHAFKIVVRTLQIKTWVTIVSLLAVVGGRPSAILLLVRTMMS